MINELLTGLTSLIAAFSTPKLTAHVERLYWDHVEGFCIVDSTAREIYAGSRNRLYYTCDSAKTWDELGELPKMTLIKQIIPISRRIIFINSSSNEYGEAFLSEDSGHTFCPCLASTGAGSCAWFLPDKGKLFAASRDPFCLMLSDDSGINWKPVGREIDSIEDPHVCSLLIRNERHQRRYYISTSRPATVYCRAEGEDVWRKCFIDPQKQNREIPLVTTWGNRLVACVTSGPHSSSERIYLSDDRGLKWHGIKCPFSIWGIGVNASDPETIWIGNYGTYMNSEYNLSLQYTQDEGLTWQVVSNCGGKLFWQLQELSNKTLYAATDFGLVRIKLN